MTEGEACSSVHLSLLIILALVLTPSVRPLWNGRVGAAVTAAMSWSRPLVKECRTGRSASRACSSGAACRGWTATKLHARRVASGKLDEC